MIYLIESIANTGEYVSPVIGRPKTIDDDVLIKIITQLALVESSADPHRRTQVINTCKTLNDLTEKLEAIGFTLKKVRFIHELYHDVKRRPRESAIKMLPTLSYARLNL